MKVAKKISTVLKALGWVVLALALVVNIYAAANSGAAWSTMQGVLNTYQVNGGIFARQCFDRQYFTALHSAAVTKGQAEQTRTSQVRADLSVWDEALAQAKEKLAVENADAYYAELAETFDVDAYRAFYEQKESGEETRQLKKAVDYLDETFKPKSSKKVKVAPASCEKNLAAYYATLSEAQGEAAGTYVEFAETVAAMVQQDLADGASIKSVKAYLEELDLEKYAEALTAVQAQERTATEDVCDDFVRALDGMTEDRMGAFAAFFQEQYDLLKSRYPDENVGSIDVFARTLGALLNDGEFDGALSTVMKQARSAALESDKTGYAATLDTLASDTVKKSDESNGIGAVVALWLLAAHVIWLWAGGVVLLILAKVLAKIVARITLNRLENAGIQEDPDILLRVNHLKQYFRSGDYINKAVDDVSFYIKRGEVFGLVGESGCGKTTTGRTIINLYDPTEGDVYFDGLRISSTQNGLPVLTRSLKNDFEETCRRKEAALKEQIAKEPARKAELTRAYRDEVRQLKQEMHRRIRQAKTNALESSVEKSKCVEKYREKRKEELTRKFEADMATLTGEAAEACRSKYEVDMKVAAKDNIMTKMQMIFQDPIASINPRMTVREIIAEGLKIRGIRDEKYIDDKVYEVLDLVGLVREHANRYPHEFSGGQRQRIGIARAIVLQPDLIIADEPISALDVSIQAQVINLLNDLRNKMGLTILFIAHNLSVVKYFSDRIGVMYYGKMVELANSDELFAHPLHPYTKSLLSAIPYPDPHHEKYRKRIEYNPALAHDYSVDQPTMREIVPGHFILCNDAEFEKYKKELGL